MRNLREKMQSDRAAVNTVEMIILIALGVFAALTLFNYVLKPTSDSAEKLGTGIGTGVDSILDSKGVTDGIDFSGKPK